MGGKSKSSSASDQSQRVIDQAGAQSAYAVGGNVSTGNISTGRNSTITTTDYGAVEAAFGFGSEAFDFGRDSLLFADSAGDRATGLQRDAMGYVANLGGQQAAFARETTQKIGELAESLSTGGASRDRQLMMWVGGAALVAVAVVATVMIARGSK